MNTCSSSKSCDSGIAAGSNGSNPLLPSPASAAAQCSTGGQSYALCVQSAGGFSTPRFVPQSFYSGHSPLHLPNNNGTLPRRTPLPTSTIVSAPYDTFQRLTPVHLHSHYPQNQLQLQPPPQHSADLRTPITCPASSSASGLGGLLTGGGVVYENYHQGVGMGAGAGGADLYRPVTPSSRRTHQVSSPLDASLIASEDSDAATVLHLATFV